MPSFDSLWEALAFWGEVILLAGVIGELAELIIECSDNEWCRKRARLLVWHDNDRRVIMGVIRVAHSWQLLIKVSSFILVVLGLGMELYGGAKELLASHEKDRTLQRELANLKRENEPIFAAKAVVDIKINFPLGFPQRTVPLGPLLQDLRQHRSARLLAYVGEGPIHQYHPFRFMFSGDALDISIDKNTIVIRGDLQCQSTAPATSLVVAAPINLEDFNAGLIANIDVLRLEFDWNSSSVASALSATGRVVVLFNSLSKTFPIKFPDDKFKNPIEIQQAETNAVR